MGWAEEELKTLQLGDARLEQRAVLLLERLGQRPSASIPRACESWAETTAAYRFLRNEEVSWDRILTAHWRATQERMAQHGVVLCIQDTTELDYHGQQMEGPGPLIHEPQRGLYLHPTYVVSTAREPLGVANAWSWAREFKDSQGVRGGISEGVRWIESYERMGESARELPQTRHVCVGDRESDMVALMRRAHELGYPADYLVRSQHNRVVPGGARMWDRVMQERPLGVLGFTLPGGRGRRQRTVTQAIRAQRLEIPDGDAGQIPVTCVIASEIDTASGAKPVVWRLLTNRRVDSLEQASELIDWYRARWEIEMFFLVLKEGCRVERLQLSTRDRLETALTLYRVIAWRINRLMRLGRNLPDLEAQLLFERDEWQAAFILNRKPLPKKMPTLNQVIRLIAQKGGFLGRKGDGEPGTRTIWQGLHDIAVFVEGVRFARSIGYSGKSCV